jgi:hypothetical protein
MGKCWKLGPEKDFVVCLVFMGKCWKLGPEKDFVVCLVFMGKTFFPLSKYNNN